FCKALIDQEVDPNFECSSALKLFAWLTENGANTGTKSTQDRNVYIRTSTALRAFIQGRNVKKLTFPRKITEIFPLPEDDMGVLLGEDKDKSSPRGLIRRRTRKAS
ncbi:MAG: hypothetical protein ACE5KG_04705, partial [Nitrososphaerales archaeon]